MNLNKIAQLTNSKIVGDPNYKISGISSVNNPSKSKITILLSEKHLSSKLDLAGAILTNKSIAESLPNQNILISNQPKVSFALLSNCFYKQPSKPLFNKKNNCFLGEDVQIGKNFLCGSNVVIEDNVSIGDNVSLGHNVVIKSGVTIGNFVNIESGTIIGSEGFGNSLTSDQKWEHIRHLGSVAIGNNVSIGSNCTIDRATLDETIICDGVIIDNLVHIAHNVVIGENTAIAAKVGIAGSCSIGKRNMIGGMVGIVDHITTVDDVIISATSTVNRNINEPGVHTGIMPILNHTKWKRVALWITKLDKIARLINLKKVK